MSPLHYLLVFIAAAFATLVSVFRRYWMPTDPIDEELPVAHIPTPSVPIPLAPTPPPIVPIDRVKLCAVAQQDFEGWYLPGTVHNGIEYPDGSMSYIHNNPGNIRDVHGAEIHYVTYDAGLEALEQYIRNVATGKHAAYPKGGDTTIMEYAHIYTGDPEPSPTNYAHAIAAAVGLTTDSFMSALLA